MKSLIKESCSLEKKYKFLKFKLKQQKGKSSDIYKRIQMKENNGGLLIENLIKKTMK